MKKIIIIISVIVIAIISCVYVKYLDYSKTVRETKSINNEFLAYRNSKIRISKVISLMGKAIELNKNNGIKQDENKLFSENDTNSIKIYLEVKSSDETKIVTIPMEELILGEKAGPTKVEKAFNDSLFETTDIQYHKKTKQVSKIVFKEIN